MELLSFERQELRDLTREALAGSPTWDHTKAPTVWRHQDGRVRVRFYTHAMQAAGITVTEAAIRELHATRYPTLF
jgi:hypothetical protein